MFIFLFLENPLVAIAFIFSIIISLTVHEVAHGVAAYFYGDTTARDLGRLTFNPIAHIDLMGAMIFLLIGFGWGKPVPINPMNFRNRKTGEIMTALAGPFSNLLLACFTALLFFFIKDYFFADNLLLIFLILLAQINLTLMIFNLIPIAPLDGSHLLENLLPDRFYKIKTYLALYGPQLLFFLIIFSHVFRIPIFGWLGSVVGWFLRLLGMPII